MRAGDLDESISAKNFLPTRQKNLEDMSDEELKAYRDSLLNEG
jgi:hypothetical protein